MRHEEHAHHRAEARRIRRAARILEVPTRTAITGVSGGTGLDDADVHAIAVRCGDKKYGHRFTEDDLAREIALALAATSVLINHLQMRRHTLPFLSDGDDRTIALDHCLLANEDNRWLFTGLIASYDDALDGHSPDQFEAVTETPERLDASTDAMLRTRRFTY